MSENPYLKLPDEQYWARSIGARPLDQIDPVSAPKWGVKKSDKIAPIGSCFAQHISRAINLAGYNYFVTEVYEGREDTADESYAVFPARFGNVYTVRQLLQLLDRALRTSALPAALPVQGKAGRWLDLYRPRIQSNGYSDAAGVTRDALHHLECTRRMFTECDLLIFTLGLTEYWRRKTDGAVLPLAPGVVTNDETAHRDIEFHNATHQEILTDLAAFQSKILSVNPAVKILLTVSPVPLIATFESRNVLVSTIASKSTLRSAVDEFCRDNPTASYFPSYEMITGPHAPPSFLAPDRREVTDVGVSFVMERFKRHYFEHVVTEIPTALSETEAEMNARFASLTEIVCDEEAAVEALKDIGTA